MRYSKIRYWGTSAAGMGVAVIGALAVQSWMPSGASWPKLAIITAMIVAAVSIILLAYRNADEIILGEHKTAWFWGSMVMLSLLGPFIIGLLWRLIPMPLTFHTMTTLQSPHAAHLPGWHAPSDAQIYFIEGMAFVALAQLAAFLLVLGYLRLRPARQ